MSLFNLELVRVAASCLGSWSWWTTLDHQGHLCLSPAPDVRPSPRTPAAKEHSKLA